LNACKAASGSTFTHPYPNSHTPNTHTPNTHTHTQTHTHTHETSKPHTRKMAVTRTPHIAAAARTSKRSGVIMLGDAAALVTKVPVHNRGLLVYTSYLSYVHKQQSIYAWVTMLGDAATLVTKVPVHDRGLLICISKRAYMHKQLRYLTTTTLWTRHVA